MSGHLTASASTQAGNQTSTPEPRSVAKPQAATIPDDNFIKKVAQNFIHSGGKQDTAHNEIFKWLFANTYHPSKVPDTDAYKDAYAKVSSNTSSPYYWVRSVDQVPTPQTARFIRDLMQVQADNVTISGWTGESAIKDLAEMSDLGKDFNEIVRRVNDTTQAISPQFKPPVDLFNKVAHRDAIQLIPDPRKGRQFAGTISEGVSITGNQITSNAALQGVFASDGAFRNLTITNNTVSTQGKHSITITGMLSGTISGNQTPADQPVTLLPLRIGGGHEVHGNIYIIGFSAIPQGQTVNQGMNYGYEAIAGGQAGMRDYRQTADIPTDIISQGKFYKDVNMAEFAKLTARYGEQYQTIMNQLVKTGQASFLSFVGNVRQEGVLTKTGN